MNNKKILIINHTAWNHGNKSHFPILAKGLQQVFSNKSDSYKLVNTKINTLKNEMIKNGGNEYNKKYIIVYGAEMHMLGNFLNNYLSLSKKLNYIMYFGMFLLKESVKKLDDYISKHINNNIKFFVDSYMLKADLKNQVSLCYPFIDKKLFNKINNENKIKKNNKVFINLRKLSNPFNVRHNESDITLLFGLIDLIKKNQDYYFYIDDIISNQLLTILKNKLNKYKNWKFENTSNDYQKYLKDKKEVDKHIVASYVWNKYRSSGNILELVGLNKIIIIFKEDNWACNFLESIQYPNVIYVKSFFNLNLNDLPEIQEYNLYDKFMDYHSIESVLTLIPESGKNYSQ